MATISYPTAVEIPGPWLVDAGTLHELDSLIDSVEATAREDRQKAAESQADETVAERSAGARIKPHDEDAHRRARGEILSEVLSRRSVYDVRSVTIDLPGGRTAAAARFSELESLATAAHERPRGFRVLVRIDNIKAEVSLAETYSSVSLSISVTPSDNDTAQEAFGRLQNWAVEKKPPRWQQAWMRMKDFAGGTLFLWILLWLFLFGEMVGRAAKRDLRAEARQLVSSGVTQANANRAIELLLAIESDYVSPTQERTRRPSRVLWAYFVSGLIILVGLRFCPTLGIGLWQGRQSVTRWRIWLRIIGISIPGLILTAIVVPWILHWSGLTP
jgi:hypothetical protein